MKSLQVISKNYKLLSLSRIGAIPMAKEKFSDKMKDGLSVQEIEDFAKKYTTEVFIVLALIIACISSIFDFFTGPTWSLLFATVGAIVAMFLPEKIAEFGKKASVVVNKKDRATQVIVGVVRIVLAIFLPFIIFAVIGLHAGLGFHTFVNKEEN